MAGRITFGVIRQPSSSGSGGEGVFEFICFVPWRQPQIHELRSVAEEGITCEIHIFARIDVGDSRRDCFQTDYATEIGRSVAIYRQKSINGKVEWLGITAPFCNTGVTWSKNILVPRLHWGDGVTYAT